MGEISISNQKLSEIFMEDNQAILEERMQFFEGVSLAYRVYMPSS